MSNLSFVRHTGDGKTRSFTLAVAGENIGYFRTSDIHGYVDDVEVPITINPSSPHIVTFTDAPKLGADILIRRQMPVKKTYADFERGNNFGQRQINNTFIQQLYLTQEILDGFFPVGFYFKQDIDLGGHKITNLGDATEDTDAVSKKVTDSLDKRLESLEHSVSGNSRFLPWTYNANGGEETLEPPYEFISARVYINGARQRAGESFDVVDNTIMLAEPLEKGDWVDVELGTEPKDFIEQDISNHVATVNGETNTIAVWFKKFFNIIKNLGKQFVTSKGSTLPRMLEDRFSDIVNVKDFNGDIQACINAAPENSLVYIQGKGLSMGKVIVNKSLTIVGDGNEITLSGLDAGFTYSGRILNLVFDSLSVKGDGTTLNSHQLCEPAGGVEVDNIIIQNCRVKDCPMGISTGFESGRILNNIAIIRGNIIVNVKGTEPGQGYGIHASSDHFKGSQGHHIIDGNYIKNAERHSIYITRSGRHTVTNNIITEHRRDVRESVVRPALSVARVSHCVIDGNRFQNCRDGNIGVGGERVESQVYDCTNIIISNNTFQNPQRLYCISLSDPTAPNDESIVSDINITGNSFYITEGIPAVALFQGFNVSVNNNSIQYRGVSSVFNTFLLSPNFETEHTANYSNFWNIKDNCIQYQSLSVTPYVFRINKRSGVEKYIYDNIIVGGHTMFDAPTTLPNEKIWIRGQDINRGLDIKPQIQPNPSAKPDRVLLRDFPAQISDPNSQTVPNFIGEQLYLSATTKSVWVAVGLTNTSWVKISN